MHQPVDNVPQQEEYDGYSLFTDVEDKQLQANNRAVVMYNIAEKHTSNGRVSPQGLAHILGYLNRLPDEERAPVVANLTLMFQEQKVQ